MRRTAFENIRRRLVRVGHGHGHGPSLALGASVSALAALPATGSASAVGCTASGFGIKGLSSAYTCVDVEARRPVADCGCRLCI